MFSTSQMEIDLAAVRQNCRLVLATARVPVMAVVKANAYGLGAVPIARACVEAGVSAFAVARITEALELRQAGIGEDILVFLTLNEAEITAAIQANLILTAHRPEQLNLIAACAAALGREARVHIKIDSGMGRFGFTPREVPALIEQLRSMRFVAVEGIYSHYANIDDDPHDPLNRKQQLAFEDAVSQFRAGGIQPRWVHMTNSAAVFNAPGSYYNLVRLGSSLLGVNPFYYGACPPGIRRVMCWRTQLVSVRKIAAGCGIGYSQTEPLRKDTWIGVIPVGYADGMRRQPGNEVLICGERVPVIGSICTDVCMLRLLRAYPVGEPVVLIGEQGSECISIESLADLWHTTRADVTCSLSARVERVYLN